MIIVKGKPYSFVVTVMQKDSFLPQDLTGYSSASTFELVNATTLGKVTTGTATLAVIDAINGKLSVVLSDTVTSELVYERGEKVDGHYAKPTYYGVLNIKFTDGTAERTAIIPAIRVAPGV